MKYDDEYDWVANGRDPITTKEKALAIGIGIAFIVVAVIAIVLVG